MTDEIPFAILQFLVDNGWIVWVYIASTIIAGAMRATWNVTEERPKWVVFILAILDVGQWNISGPAKLIATVLKGPKT